MSPVYNINTPRTVLHFWAKAPQVSGIVPVPHNKLAVATSQVFSHSRRWIALDNGLPNIFMKLFTATCAFSL